MKREDVEALAEAIDFLDALIDFVEEDGISCSKERRAHAAALSIIERLLRKGNPA